MVRPGVTIVTSGPVFRHGGAPIRRAVRDTIRDLVAKGEREVKTQLYAGHGVDTGHYRRSVHGEATSDLHGTIHDSRVVYGPWLEGVSSRNQRSRFKGYRMFRNAKQRLERLKVSFLNRRIQQAVRKLN
jgi:hypothetical protein